VTVELSCPHCGLAVSVTDAEADHLTCPGCAQVFLLPPSEPEGESKLSAARVRMLSQRRRAMVRTRSFALIGVFGMLGLGLACVLRVSAVANWTVRGAYVLLAGFALWGAWRMWIKAGGLSKQLARSDLDEPESPPSFEGLSDGSQQWRNLEEIR
jgi:hypothetical protein